MADVTLKYKGATIGELSESGSKTLETAGKYCEADILLEYVKSGGGSFEGLQLVSVDSTSKRPTEWKWKGNTIPAYAFFYFFYSAGNNQRCVVDFSEVEYLESYGTANCGIEYSNTENLKEIGAHGLACRIPKTQINLAGKTLNLANFTGYGIGKTKTNDSVCRSDEIANYYGTVLCPKIEYIPQYMFYNVQASMTVQLGSVGYPVKEVGQRPFGAANGANSSVTVYTTGALLDTVKSAVQNSAGANYTFVYKASEDTTYNGTAYAAGDTIITS